MVFFFFLLIYLFGFHLKKIRLDEIKSHIFWRYIEQGILFDSVKDSFLLQNLISVLSICFFTFILTYKNMFTYKIFCICLCFLCYYLKWKAMMISFLHWSFGVLTNLFRRLNFTKLWPSYLFLLCFLDLSVTWHNHNYFSDIQFYVFGIN